MLQIEWAQKAERPEFIPRGRPKGVKAEGLRFEAALAKQIAPAKRGQWFKYRQVADVKVRYCQTDLLVVSPKVVLIVECKLSWVPEGQESLDRLYVPVVRKALDRQVYGMVATRYLKRGMPSKIAVVSSLEDGIKAVCGGLDVVLHWIPGTPLQIVA